MPGWIINLIISMAIKFGLPWLVKHLPWLPKEIVEILNWLLDQLKDVKDQKKELKLEAIRQIKSRSGTAQPAELVDDGRS